MIQVVSRFRVKNCMKDAVRHVFINPPHLVDNARGFLGMEVIAELNDVTTFYLLTRWADPGGVVCDRNTVVDKSDLRSLRANGHGNRTVRHGPTLATSSFAGDFAWDRCHNRS